MKCESCGGEDIKLVTGTEIYPYATGIHDKKFWRCACGAYVGCHSGSDRPYGTPANKELRQLRRHVHEVLDPYWEKFGMTRTEAYAFLAKRLALTPSECHVGLFDVEKCKRALAALRKYDRYIEHVMKIGMATKFERWSKPEPDKLSENLGCDRGGWLADLEEQITMMQREDDCITAGKCPGCGGALSRTIDERQVGPVELALQAGTWFNYRCGNDPPIGVAGPRACSWRGVDRKEPIGEN